MDTTNIERYLDSFGKQVVRDAKGILSSAKGNTALGSSIRFEVTPDSTGFSTKFYMEDYGTYLDKGVSGTQQQRSFKSYNKQTQSSPYSYKAAKGHSQPPTGIIDKWVVKKGLEGTRDKEGKFIKRKSLVFVVARSIGRKGIKSLSFFQEPLGVGYRALKEELLKEVKLDIESYLVTFTKK